MFRPGEMVYHTGSTRSGTVVECDGDTVYIMQPNGVELDFPASELTGTPPAGNGQTEPAVQAPRILTNRDITWRVPYLANSAVQSYGADERNGSKYACIAVNPQLELPGKHPERLDPRKGVLNTDADGRKPPVERTARLVVSLPCGLVASNRAKQRLPLPRPTRICLVSQRRAGQQWPDPREFPVPDRLVMDRAGVCRRHIQDHAAVRHDDLDLAAAVVLVTGIVGNRRAPHTRGGCVDNQPPRRFLRKPAHLP